MCSVKFCGFKCPHRPGAISERYMILQFSNENKTEMKLSYAHQKLKIQNLRQNVSGPCFKESKSLFQQDVFHNYYSYEFREQTPTKRTFVKLSFLNIA